ncbi:Conserved oligomeric Golgi complex subunit 2 [Spiromyces aspiralis]|uniref:Conserved oligomeric Golgi complex subunit 2 n=1 Tax=Spiromyces aspiralis TaxID=68401 RepID=A0ACC1HX12_9FUNG|nr:Conserved oligomeric Golgi complex subunit 2 [Spiromyces aspiralis]
MVRPKLSKLYWQHDQSSIFTRSREEGPPTSEGPNSDCNNKQRSLVSGNGDFSVLSDMLLSTLTTSVLHPLVRDHLSRLVERIAQSLATRCFEDGDKTNVTKSVRQVPSLYRHTNRPPPAGPLPYVDQILAPLSEFVQDESNRMMLSDIAIDIDNNRIAMRAVELRACELATAKYQELIRDLLKGVAKTEASLQRFKRFTTRGGKDSGNVSSEVSAEVVDLRGTIPSTDDNKIRRQVWFDAMAFISNVKQQLGVGHGDTQTAAIADQFLRPLSQLIEPFGQ